MTLSPVYRILVIDDQLAIHEDYRKILGRRVSGTAAAIDQAATDLFGDAASISACDDWYEVDSALQGQEGLDLVKLAVTERRPYTLAFVDIRMPPGWDGVETVRRIWSVDPEMLIVICSAYSDYSWQEMVRELGRNDRYLILRKPFDNIEVRQFAMALSERWRSSRTDVLTGLLNRRAFDNYFTLEWQNAKDRGTPLAFIMLDLDHFKRINDTLGHQAGDHVLKRVADLVTTIALPSYSVGRYGGDEFCILLPHTSEAQAVAWAENTRRAIEQSVLTFSEREIPISASIGVGEIVSTDTRSEQLVERADLALISAKGAGRNCVVSYSSATRSASAAADVSRDASCWTKVSLSEVMTSPVLSLKTTATIGEAIEYFATCRVDFAPIVDCDGQLVGQLDEKDLVAVLPRIDSRQICVDRVMRRPSEYHGELTPIAAIVRWLDETNSDRTLIVRDGRPIGLVSRRNLIRCAWNWAASPGERNLPSKLLPSGPLDQRRVTQMVQQIAKSVAAVQRQLAGNWDDCQLILGFSSIETLLEPTLASAPRGPTVLPAFLPGGIDAAPLDSSSVHSS
jgi:diguanylate cyclase (GGDEF)-like protein